MTQQSLETAYRLRTPEDSRKLYAAWARDYDAGFAQAMDYQLPFAVAQTFVGLGGQGPVLDVGAGTGLGAVALRDQGLTEVDGTDISHEMLSVAVEKNLYEHTFIADITAGLPLRDGAYRGVVSSGTFTLGHLGPLALPEVLRVIAPGGLGVISVGLAHYRAASFDLAIADLPDNIWVAEIEVPIYGPEHQGGNAGDSAILICAHVL
jgi:predicted TPR repeat methyltransferase